MEDEVDEKHAIHRLVMPPRWNYRVRTKLEDSICGLLVRQEVAPTHVKEITK